ncbi:hypothetical protein DmAi_20800 [Acetobacter persici]|uniref:Uncharacterized protein n=1 Tax=Acetobacter persici TaxID=1076596 RepID=A0A6V8I8Z0_9PROT|nr:hypothetical protein HK19_06975 [Acetobacter persici]GFE94021.1 hypothetical protein DmAi_20800 [Acetobacter persici]
MSGTDSSHDASVTAQDHSSEFAVYAEHEATVQEAHAVMADPVVPVTAAPVPSAPQPHPEHVAVKEVFQMVGAMVFVFCFAALGFNAMYHAGY